MGDRDERRREIARAARALDEMSGGAPALGERGTPRRVAHGHGLLAEGRERKRDCRQERKGRFFTGCLAKAARPSGAVMETPH
jgi:hypothetical protein